MRRAEQVGTGDRALQHLPLTAIRLSLQLSGRRDNIQRDRLKSAIQDHSHAHAVCVEELADLLKLGIREVRDLAAPQGVQLDVADAQRGCHVKRALQVLRDLVRHDTEPERHPLSIAGPHRDTW